MGAERTTSTSGCLKGIHGMKLVPKLPYKEENEDNNITICGEIEVLETTQKLLFGPCLRPIQCSFQGDHHIAETFANVVTSLPFIVLGLQAPRKNVNASLYANSLIGVGVASSLYHSSRGEARKYLSWADYTMIATTTLCLSRALRNQNPKFLMAASTLLLPFQPLMVSVVHTGLMEVAFARRALKRPELRTAHNLHTMSSLLGGALFIAEDCFPQTPYIHAAWHIAAAIGVGTCNKLLE